MKPLFLSASAIAVALCSTAMAEQLINDNLVVSGNLCAGPDCATGDADLNYKGIVLEADIPKIHFNSSDSTLNDWKLQGSATNGGARNFSLWAERTSGTTNPLLIRGQAPSSSFVIEDNGDIGFGTGFPQAELHVMRSAHPSLRLEQDTSGGLGHHTWDVTAGDGGLSFIDIGSPFSLVPMTIENGVPTASLYLANGGNVGSGTSSPSAAFHVARTNGTARIFVEETGGSGAQELFKMSSNGGSYFTLTNTTSGRDWFFTHENNVAGRFIITSSTNPSEGLFYSPNGNMTIGGTLTQNSDKNAKMAIEPVDAAAILDKVAALPVSTWTYKDDSSGARHLGPMAQDFHAAFGLGETSTGISTLDTSGVALASIKALRAELETAQRHIAQQQEIITALIEQDTVQATRIDEQNHLIETLVQKLSPIKTD